MKRHQTKSFGFAIIEALVALVVVGFGMLALAGMQGALTRNVDVAQQRTEATRLAQEKMEELRSFIGISGAILAATASAPASATSAGPLWNSADMGGDNDDGMGGSDTISTNATYTRTWLVDVTPRASGTEPYERLNETQRLLGVLVTWVDRTGETQSVALSSFISKTDPADSGFLGFPLPENTYLKRVKNRNLDIPIPSIDLGNSESAVKFGNTGKYVLFSNITGGVVKICTPTLDGTTDISDILKDDAKNNCIEVTGYIVAGYIKRDTSVSNTDWDAIKNDLGIDISAITRNSNGSSEITCQFGDALNQNTSTIIQNYKYYLCVVPLSTPYNWSGTIRIAGPSVWNNTNNKYYVCRYEYTENSTLDINQRNIQPYVDVNKSIDQQNYLIATTSNSTSTADPICPSEMTVANVSEGVLHQDCRSASNPTGHSTACPLRGYLPTYTITYNGNGMTSGSAPVDPLSPYTENSTIKVLGNTGAMAISGKTFAGWNISADGSGTPYAAGSALTITDNTTLFAQWSTETTYPVTYHGNGSTGGNVPIDANSPYIAGTSVTVLGNTGNLVKDSLKFSGWNTAEDGSGSSYKGGDSLVIGTAATVLYATWTTPQPYTVTYSSNGATGGTVPTDSNSYIDGSLVTVLGNTGALVKTGYSFNGWTSSSGTLYSPSQTFNILSDTILSANWQQVTLSRPIPSWTGTILVWSVTGATGYTGKECYASDGKVCTPDTPIAGSGSSIQPPAMPNSGNNKDVWCYTVTATGSPYLDSAASAVKCVIHAANGNFSYQ